MANKSFYNKNDGYIKITNPPSTKIIYYCIGVLVVFFLTIISSNYISIIIKDEYILNVCQYILIITFILCYVIIIFYAMGKFTHYKILTDDTKKILNYQYNGKKEFLKTVTQNAHRKGYIFSKELVTNDWNENFFILSKKDIELTCPTDEKIAIYFSDRYRAEYFVERVNRDRRMCYRNIPETKKIISMFCDSKKNNYALQTAINSINSIVIVVVDEKDKIVEDVLLKDHMNNVLFVVISLDCPNKIFIGNDLRMNQDDDYIMKIEELAAVIEMILPPNKELNNLFAPCQVIYKGKEFQVSNY